MSQRLSTRLRLFASLLLLTPILLTPIAALAAPAGVESASRLGDRATTEEPGLAIEAELLRLADLDADTVTDAEREMIVVLRQVLGLAPLAD